VSLRPAHALAIAAALCTLTGPSQAQPAVAAGGAPAGTPVGAPVLVTGCGAAHILENPDPHPAARCQVLDRVHPEPPPTSVSVCRTNDHFGAVIAAGGDFNGDGTPDIAVAGFSHDHLPNTACEVWVFSGKGAAPLVVVTGDGRTDLLGESLTFVSDLNGDGCDELAIGAPGAGRSGRVYVIAGRSAPGPGRIAAREAALAILEGDVPGRGFGFALTAGDLDGDGRHDLAIGAPGTSSSDAAEFAGEVLVFGGAALVDPEGGPLLMSARHADRRLVGDSAGARFGFALATVGPDADGSASRLAVGAPRSLGRAIAKLSAAGHGEVLLFGSDDAPLQRWTGDKYAGEGSAFGHALASGHDLDGDGIDDLAIGAPLRRGDASEKRPRGAAFAVNSVTGAVLIRVDDSAFSGSVGARVALAADVSGDGHPDLVTSSPIASLPIVDCSQHGKFHEQGGPMSGGVLLVDGASGDVFGRLFGESGRDRIGWGLAVHDLDGDGLSEVIAGAMGWSPPRAKDPALLKEVGRAYVFAGSQLPPE